MQQLLDVALLSFTITWQQCCVLNLGDQEEVTRACIGWEKRETCKRGQQGPGKENIPQEQG